MLRRENFGGRHQRALPAGRHGLRRRQRGHDCLAAAHVALQQPVHRRGLREVGGDFGHAALLSRREGEGDGRPQLRREAMRPGRGGQRRRLPPLSLCAGLLLGQLLRQQFVELQAPLRRMRARFQRGQGRGRRSMQGAQARGQIGQMMARQFLLRHGVAPDQPLERPSHGLAQIALRHAGRGGIDRRERVRQGRIGVHQLPGRVHHLPTKQALPHLPMHPQPHPGLQGFELIGVEVEQPQGEDGVARFRVLQPHQQLPTRRAALHLRLGHHSIRGDKLTVAQRAQRREPRFIFIAQRQMQRNVPVGVQTQPGERRGPCRFGLARRVFARRACPLRRIGNGVLLRGLARGGHRGILKMTGSSSAPEPDMAHPLDAEPPIIPPFARVFVGLVIVVTNSLILPMPKALSTLRTAWFSMLVLLLGLAPFIHGHLGQPVQSGWHIHALTAAAQVQASPQFSLQSSPDGLACLASHPQHTAQQSGFALQTPEPSDVELASGIAQSRLSQIRLASVLIDTEVVLPTFALASQHSLAVTELISWPQLSDDALPRVHHGLPPPGQAPPSTLV